MAALGTAWPVMVRELRAEARNRGNYWARVYAGLLLLAMFASVLVLVRDPEPARLGGLLFGNVHTVMAGLIWLGGPLLTADCLARERREGTLGLLFLTPLTPVGVALGKSLIHGVRAFMLWLVSAPLLFLPVMWGGVTWKDGVLALLLDASGLMLALSAGLLASTLTSSWTRAVILAEGFSLLLLGLFAATCGVEFMVQAWPLVPLQGTLETPPWPVLVAVAVGCGLAGLSNVAGIWREVWAHFPPLLQDGLLWAAARNLVLMGGLAACVVGLAGWRLRSLRAPEVNAPVRLQMVRVWMAPRFALGWFRRRQRRLLDRNPMVWLQGYGTPARLAKWGWCGVVMAWAWGSSWWVGLGGGYLSEQDWLEWSLGTFLLLSVGISFSAVGTFRRERETGALELILVTPLRVRTIITGRLQGIWLQFAPAIGVLAVVTVMGAGRRTWAWDDAPFMAYVVSTYLTMPVLGMMASTLPGNWMAAWVATLLVGLLSPFAPEAAMWCGATLWNVVRMREFELNNEMARALSDFWNSTAALQAIRTHALPLLSQWVVALGAGVALHWRLRRRALGGR